MPPCLHFPSSTNEVIHGSVICLLSKRLTTSTIQIVGIEFDENPWPNHDCCISHTSCYHCCILRPWQWQVETLFLYALVCWQRWNADNSLRFFLRIVVLCALWRRDQQAHVFVVHPKHRDHNFFNPAYEWMKRAGYSLDEVPKVELERTTERNWVPQIPPSALWNLGTQQTWDGEHDETKEIIL